MVMMPATCCCKKLLPESNAAYAKVTQLSVWAVMSSLCCCQKYQCRIMHRRWQKKIIQTIGEPIELPGGNAQVGASIGIALMQSPEITTEDLMHQADTAMYEAKRRGKNQSVLWSSQSCGDAGR